MHRGGCAADVATTTRVLASPFWGHTTNECGFPLSIRSLFHVRIFWLPDDFDNYVGTTVPLSGGLVGLWRCGAMRRNALSPWAIKHKTASGTSLIAEYRRVEPEHCPIGASSGGASCEQIFLWAYHRHCLLCARALSFE